MHFNSNPLDFLSAAKDKKFDIIFLNNKIVDLDSLKISYRGSHFIRDPRDLCVSALKYHRRSSEKWLLSKQAPEYFTRVLEPARQLGFDVNLVNTPTTVQQYLRQVSDKEALIFEICWREYVGHFDAMESWNYDDPNIIEMKYENIINNEAQAFSSICEHYQLDRETKKKVVENAEKFSYSKQKSAKAAHIGRGVSGQWREFFDKDAETLFTSLRPNLLPTLGYPDFGS